MPSLNLSPTPPVTLFDRMAKNGDGKKLRSYLLYEGLQKLFAAFEEDKPLPPFHADILLRFPDIVPKLVEQAHAHIPTRNAILASPLHAATALVYDLNLWMEDAAPVVQSSPEATYHFVTGLFQSGLQNACDLGPYVTALRQCPFWLTRLAKAIDDQSILTQISPESESPNTELPYCRLHYLICNPEVDCGRSWAVIFSDPVVAVLAASFLRNRGYPWDMIPFSSLAPREASNMLALWPNDHVPLRLWDEAIKDPQWFVDCWVNLPTRRIPPTKTNAFRLRLDTLVANYAFGNLFCDWWRTNVAETSPGGKPDSGSHDEGLTQ